MSTLICLQKIRPMDRVRVDGRKLVLETSVFPSFFRFIGNHSRQDLVFFMTLLLGDLDKRKNMDLQDDLLKLENEKIMEKIEGAANGVQLMAETTYASDGDTRENLVLTVARMRLLIKSPINNVAATE